MKSARVLYILMIGALILTVIAGCAPNPPATEPPATQPPATEPPVATEPPAPEPVTISYANWNLGTEEENNIQRQLIAAYTELYPHVTIEVVDMSGEGSWDEKLTALAAKGELPDVFMADKTTLYITNGWLADLTDLTGADADWVNVSQAVKENVTFDGKVLAIPAAQFIMGYWVNLDLYDAANLVAPEYGVSAEEFFTAVTDLTNIPEGVLGLDEQEFVMNWYANTQDPALGYHSFDGLHMNYNSAAFKDAVAKAYEMRPYTWQGLTDEQKTNFISQGPWELFTNQEVGVRWDASWNVPGWISNTFSWDFVGIPGGTQALVFDLLVVSTTSVNVEEAYNFAKWMGFSPEAYAVEVELALAAGAAPKMPISADAASIALYKSYVDKPGIIAALENLDNSLIESLSKVVPGFATARYEGKPGIDIGTELDVNVWYVLNVAALGGQIKFEDYSAQLETYANQVLDDARAALIP